MTVHLMENTENGDKRIENELSRKMDINPNSYMTRKTFMSALMRRITAGRRRECCCLARNPARILKRFTHHSTGRYSLFRWVRIQDLWDGNIYDPDELLHFVINPDAAYPWKGRGYRAALKDVANGLKQHPLQKKDLWNQSGNHQ